MCWFFLYVVLRFGPLSLIYGPCVSSTELSPSVADDPTLEKFEKFPIHTFNTHNEYLMYATKPMHSSPTIDNQQSTSRNRKSTDTFVRETIHTREKRSRSKCKGPQRQCVLKVGGENPKSGNKSKHSFKEEHSYESDAEPYSSDENGIDYTNTITGTARRKGLIKQQRALQVPSSLQHKRRKKDEVYAKRYKYPVDSVGHKKHFPLHLPQDRLDDSGGSKKHLLSGNFFHIDKNSLKTHVISEDDDIPQGISNEVAKNSTKDVPEMKSNSTKETSEGKDDNKSSSVLYQEKPPVPGKLSPKDKEKFINDISKMWEKGNSNTSRVNSPPPSLKENESYPIQLNGSTTSSNENPSEKPNAENMTRTMTKDEEKQRGKTMKSKPSGVDDVVEHFNPDNVTSDSNHTRILKDTAEKSTSESDEKLYQTKASPEKIDDEKATLFESNLVNKTSPGKDDTERNCKRMDCQKKKIRYVFLNTELYKTKKITAEGEKHEVLDSPPEKLTTSKDINVQAKDDNFLSTDQFYKSANRGLPKSQTVSQGKQKSKNTSNILKNDDAQFTTGVQANYSRFLGITEETSPIHLNSSTDISFTRDAQANHTRFIGVRFEPARLLNSSTTGTKRNQSKMLKETNPASVGLHRKDATLNTAYNINTGMASPSSASTSLHNPAPQNDNSLLPSVHNSNAAVYDNNGGANNPPQQNTNTLQQDTSTQNDNSASSTASSPLLMVITPPDVTNTTESSAENTNTKQDGEPADASPEKDKHPSPGNKENSKSKAKESSDTNHIPASSGNTSKPAENTTTGPAETFSTDESATTLPQDPAKSTNKVDATSADFNATNEQSNDDTNVLQPTSSESKEKEPSLSGEHQDNIDAATSASQSTGDGADVNGDGVGAQAVKTPKKESHDTLTAAAPPETHDQDATDNNVAPSTPTPPATQPPSTTTVVSSKQNGYESSAESTAAQISGTAATAHKGTSGKQTTASTGAVGYHTSTSPDTSQSQQQPSTENTATSTATTHKGTNWKQAASTDTSAEYVAPAHEATSAPPERVKPAKPAQQVSSSTEATQTTHNQAEASAQHLASSTQAMQTTHKGAESPDQHIASSTEATDTTHKGRKSNKQNAGSTDISTDYIVEESGADTETEYVEEAPEKGKSSKQHGTTAEVATEEYVTPVVEETPQKEKSGKHAPPTTTISSEEYVTPVAETSNKGKSHKQNDETTQESTENVPPVLETSQEASTEYVAGTSSKGKSGKHNSSSIDYVAVEQEPAEEVNVPIKANKGKSSSKYAASSSDQNLQSSQNANTTKPAAAISETVVEESSTEYISPEGESQHKAGSAKYDAASSETSQQASEDHTATTSDTSQNTNSTKMKASSQTADQETLADYPVTSMSTHQKGKSTKKTQSASTDASQTAAPTDYAASPPETPQKNKSTKHATTESQIPNGESSTDLTAATTDTKPKEKSEKNTPGEQNSSSNLDSYNAHILISPSKNQEKSSSESEKTGLQSEGSNAYLVLSPAGSSNETKENGNIAQTAPYNGTSQSNTEDVQNVSSSAEDSGTTPPADYYQGRQEDQEVGDSHSSQETRENGQFSSFHPHEKHTASKHRKLGEISNEADSVHKVSKQTNKTSKVNDQMSKNDQNESPVENETKEGNKMKKSTKKVTDITEQAPTQNKGLSKMEPSPKMKEETDLRVTSKKKASSSSYSQRNNEKNERVSNADLSQNQNARESAHKNGAEHTDMESEKPSRLGNKTIKKYEDGEEAVHDEDKGGNGKSHSDKEEITPDEKDESARIHPITAQKMSSSFHGKVSLKEKENFEKAEKQQSHGGLHPLSTSFSGSNHHDELASKVASKDQKNVNKVDSREIGKENDLENTEDAINQTIKEQSSGELKIEKANNDAKANGQKAGDSKKLSSRLRAKKPLHVKESVDTVVSGKQSDAKDANPLEEKNERTGKSSTKGAKEKNQMSKGTKEELKTALKESKENDDMTNGKENEKPVSEKHEKNEPKGDTLFGTEEDRNKASNNSENAILEIGNASSKEQKEPSEKNTSNEKLSKGVKVDANLQTENYNMTVNNEQSHSNNQSSSEKAPTEGDIPVNNEGFVAEIIKDNGKISAEVRNSDQPAELDMINNTMENKPTDKNSSMLMKEKEAAEQRAEEQTAVELKAVKEKAESEDEEYSDKGFASSRKGKESTGYKEKYKAIAQKNNKSQNKEEETIDNEGKEIPSSKHGESSKSIENSNNTDVSNGMKDNNSPKVIVSLETEIPKDTTFIDSNGRLSTLSNIKDEDENTTKNDNTEKPNSGRKNTDISEEKDKGMSEDGIQSEDPGKDRKRNDGTVFDGVAIERPKSDNEVVSKKLSSKLINQKESGAKDNIKGNENKEDNERTLESGAKGSIKEYKKKEEGAHLESGEKENVKETENKEEKGTHLESGTTDDITEPDNKEEETGNLDSGVTNSSKVVEMKEGKATNLKSGVEDGKKEVENKERNAANLESGDKENNKEKNVTSLLMIRNLTREKDDETEISLFTHSGQSTIPHSTRSSSENDDDDTPDLSDENLNDDRSLSKRKQHEKKHDCTIHFVNEKWKKWAKCRHTFKDEDSISAELEQQSTGGLEDSGGGEIEFTDTSKEPVDLNVYVHTAARSKTMKYRRRSNHRSARYYGGKRKFYVHGKKESIINLTNQAQKHDRKHLSALYGKLDTSPRFTHHSIFHANHLEESTGSKKHLLSGNMQTNKHILKSHVVLDDFPDITEKDEANFERLFPGSKGYVKLKTKLARLCRRSKDPKCQLHSRKFLSKALSKLSKEEDEKEESRNRTAAAVKELENVHKGFKHAHRELNNSTLSAIDELEKILSTKHKLKHNFHALLHKEQLLAGHAHSVDDNDSKDNKDNSQMSKIKSTLSRLDRKKDKLLHSFHILLHKTLTFFRQFDHSPGRSYSNLPDDLKFEDPSGRSAVSRQMPLHDGDQDDDDSINTRFMREGDGSIDKLVSVRHRLHTLSDDDDDVDNIKVSNLLSHLHNHVQLNSFDDNDDEDNNVALKTGKKNVPKTKEKVHALADDDDDNEFLIKTSTGLRQVVGFHDDDDVLDDDDDRDNSAGHKLDKMRNTLVSKSQSSDDKKDGKNDGSKSTEKGQSRHAVVSHTKLESGGWTTNKDVTSDTKDKKSPRRRKKKKVLVSSGKGDSSSALALFNAVDEPEDDTESSGDSANVKTVSGDFNVHVKSLKTKSKNTISSTNSELPSTSDFNERFNSIKSKEVNNEGKETASSQSTANVDSLPVKPSMVLNALVLTPPETGKVLTDNIDESKTTKPNQSIEEIKGSGTGHLDGDKKAPTASQSSETTASKSSPVSPLLSVQSITGTATTSSSKNDDSSVLKAALDAYLNAKLADEAKASAISKIKASATETAGKVTNETSTVSSKSTKNNNGDTDKNILKDIRERGQPNNFYSVDDAGQVSPLEYQSPSATAFPSEQESYTWPPRGSSATMQVLDSITHLAGLLEHITKTQNGSHLRSCAFCSPMVNLCKDMTHLLSEFMKILGGFLRFVHTFGTPKVRDNATYNHLYNNFDHFYNVYANLC